MDYLYFVVLSTVVFFIIFRLYKSRILADKKLKQKNSHLIFLASIPVLLYITKYLFIKEQVIPILEKTYPVAYPVAYNESVISSI
jgi:hypothetical protein